MGKWKLCFRWSDCVDHPAAFRGHVFSKKNRPLRCLFPFRMAPVLPLRTAWIAGGYPFAASLRDGERQRCWKRGSGDGQRRWDYCTARLSDLSMPLSEVRRSPEPSAGHRRQPIARSAKFVRRAYSRRALDCAYAFSHRARCTKTTLLETW